MMNYQVIGLIISPKTQTIVYNVFNYSSNNNFIFNANEKSSDDIIIYLTFNDAKKEIFEQAIFD